VSGETVKCGGSRRSAPLPPLSGVLSRLFTSSPEGILALPCCADRRYAGLVYVQLVVLGACVEAVAAIVYAEHAAP
jgi:hypothetical protein